MVWTILINSRLTPEEWKQSWRNRVREERKRFWRNRVREERKRFWRNRVREERKQFWRNKLREHKREKESAVPLRAYYAGYFYDDRDFILEYHKEYEIKGMRVGLYFRGHLEEAKEGCQITGKFKKKVRANFFLLFGEALCLIALFRAGAQADYGILLLALGLFVVLLICFLTKPQKDCQRLRKYLERISKDESFRENDDSDVGFS